MFDRQPFIHVAATEPATGLEIDWIYPAFDTVSAGAICTSCSVCLSTPPHRRNRHHSGQRVWAMASLPINTIPDSRIGSVPLSDVAPQHLGDWARDGVPNRGCICQPRFPELRASEIAPYRREVLCSREPPSCVVGVYGNFIRPVFQLRAHAI